MNISRAEGYTSLEVRMCYLKSGEREAVPDTKGTSHLSLVSAMKALRILAPAVSCSLSSQIKQTISLVWLEH